MRLRVRVPGELHRSTQSIQQRSDVAWYRMAGKVEELAGGFPYVEDLASKEDEEERDLIYLARARTDFLWGNYEDAVGDAEKALNGLDRRWAHDSVKVMPCKSLYGLLLALRSEVQTGLEMCETAVTMLIDALGAEHSDALQARGLLAEAYLANGKYASAEKGLQETVEASKEVHGKCHPETIRYQSLLALAMLRAGKYSEAFESAEETLCSPMGTCFAPEEYSDHGPYTKALVSVKQFKRIHSYRSQILGKENPSTVSAKRDLIASWIRLGKWEDPDSHYDEDAGEASRQDPERFRPALVGDLDLGEAEKALQEVVATHDAQLGRDHPTTLWSLLGLFTMKAALTEDFGCLPSMLDDALRRVRNESAQKERFVESLCFQYAFAAAISRGDPVKSSHDLKLRAMGIFRDVESELLTNPPSRNFNLLRWLVGNDMRELHLQFRSLRARAAEKALEELCQIGWSLDGADHANTAGAHLWLAEMKLRFGTNHARREEALAILERASALLEALQTSRKGLWRFMYLAQQASEHEAGA
ncbi:uncharacterized protein PG986_010682 [Apiospora aurea]|uniref:Kinesin light chain n=1 Tax=Apiospora aurea TaxID=335848 RepID=A0ABR1Q3F2_9PEZI